MTDARLTEQYAQIAVVPSAGPDARLTEQYAQVAVVAVPPAVRVNEQTAQVVVAGATAPAGVRDITSQVATVVRADRPAPTVPPTMVEIVQATAVASSATGTVTLTQTPIAGDVVVLCIKFSGSAGTVSTVSGLGATWSAVPYGSKVLFWTGVGATATGTTTVTLSGSITNWQITAYLIRDLTSPAFTGIGNTSSGANTVLTQRLVGGSVGQVVLAGVVHSAANLTFPTGSTPTSGWTAVGQQISGRADDAWIIPTGRSEGFGVGMTSTSSGACEVTTVAFGNAVMPQVRNVIQGSTFTSTTPGISIVQTPGGGDVVLLAIKRLTAVAVTVSSVSGLGATWSQVYSGTAIKYWLGTGATAAGAITVTLATNGDSQVTAYTISGLTVNTVLGATATATGTALTGPLQEPGLGQAIIESLVATATSTITFPSAKTPSTGWTVGTEQTINSRTANDAWRVPGSTASHGTDATGTASVAMEITSVAIGPPPLITPPVPGVVFWLRGKDLGAGGSTVTAPLDQSPNRLAVTTNGITVAAGATPNGGKAFDITNAINFAAMPTLTEADFWVVVKSRSASSRSAWSLGSDSQLTHFTYSDGVVYDKTWTSSRRSFTPTMTVASTWRLYRVKNDAAGNWQAWLDNTSQLTATAAFGVAASPKIANDWDGLIAETIILDHVATSGEVGTLITYFNTEHGLTVTGGTPLLTSGFGALPV